LSLFALPETAPLRRNGDLHDWGGAGSADTHGAAQVFASSSPSSSAAQH
jgi:hypothetical protein